MIWASISSIVGILAAELFLFTQSDGTAAPSLRPYVHVFLAYGLAWAIILFWVSRIWRGLKRLESSD